MKRLAIISSYNEKCGNASYTHVLKNAFSEHMEVEVIPLDLFVLQKTSTKARKLGDAHIDRIARKLQGFDYVNIQFEAGLYGTIVTDILNRVSRLIKASPNLIFTMHRIDLQSKSLLSRNWKSIRSLKFGQIPSNFRKSKFENLYERLAKLCDTQAKSKNVWISVHTKRERRIVQEYYGVNNCFDHPLAYLTNDERKSAWAANDRKAFHLKYGFPAGSKIVGLFGYLSNYKGIETAISALSELPKNYVLALFGSQHPQSVRPDTPIDPYLESLLDQIGDEADKKVKRQLKRISKMPRNIKGIDSKTVKNLIEFEITSRIRFIGNVPDPEFIEGLRLSDAVVLPYLEVGQSMSGVVALAVESGATLFCANNSSFSEVIKYYDQVFHSFDIGNHVELAQKIVRGGSDFKTERDLAYSRYNIKSFIAGALDKFGHKPNEVPSVVGGTKQFKTVEVK